jgi:hypothetical protein
MSKAQKDRKRQAGFTATGGSGKKFHFVKKSTQGPPQSSSTGHWRVTPSQKSRLGTSSSERHSSSHTSLVHPQPTKITAVLSRIVAVIIVGSPGITSMSAPSPGRTSRVKAQDSVMGTKARSPWCRSRRANSTSPPWLTFQREQ